jgi:hypothetical protein
MKFAQSLEDHIVPEWRAQYLDYKLGKKKLKKLSRKPSVLTSNNKTPSITGRSRGNMAKYSNVESNKDVNTFNALIPIDSGAELHNNENFIDNHDSDLEQTTIETFKDKHFNEDQLTMQTGGSSMFALPESAIDYHDSNPTMYGSTKQPFPSEDRNANKSSTEIQHDRTPLLNPNIPTSSSEWQPIHRRSSVIALFDSFKRSPSISFKREQDTELEDLAAYARDQFIKWVDSELDKVELFYKEKEDACVERFLILQDQIIQLENQKLLSKKKWLRTKKMLRAHSGSTNHEIGDHEGDANIDDEYDDEDYDDDDDNGYDEYLHAGFLSGYNGNNYGVFGAAQRNFKLLSFWTRRKLRIINKFDMPSLPAFEWLKEDGKIEKQYYEEGYYSDEECEDDTHEHPIRDGTTSSTAHIRDFQRRKKSKTPINVPYFVARRMIKKAVYELYRSMELLKSYKLMNRIAFRKLIKKYDKTTGDSMLGSYMKKIDESYFTKSDVLENLMTNVEEMYTRYFENGNRKVSVTKLRTNPFERTYYVADYFSGLFFGLSIPFVVYTFYYGIHETVVGKLPNGKYLLQIWGGFLIITAMSWLFSINCLVWTKFKVNYKFIFEFNQHDALDFKQYMVLPSLFFFFGGLISWFSFQDYWPNIFSGYDFPWIFLGLGILILFCPFDLFYFNARLWLLSTLTRLLLSGFYPVEFRDFFLGDIFCSLTYSISNVSMFFCIYANRWVNCEKCGSGQSRLLGFLQCLPSIWRFLQCFRRYADTGDWFPHLANMLKYSVSTLYYMSLSLYRIETVNHYKVLLIFWATINSIYSSIWDILMDWSLFQFDSKYFLLRDEITFKSPNVYYIAMVIDVILRFQWVFYVLFPKQIQQSAITSFCIAVSEILRRFIWIFFRMENEHATNVHLFRASRESPLPYPIIKRKVLKTDSIQTSGFDDGNSKDLGEQDIRKRNGSKKDIHITTPQLSFARSYLNDIHTVNNEHNILCKRLPNTFDAETYLPIDEDSYNYGTNKDEGYSTSLLSSVGRYVQELSRTLRTAHIKDFQRRKVNKRQVLSEEEDETDVDEAN